MRKIMVSCAFGLILLLANPVHVLAGLGSASGWDGGSQDGMDTLRGFFQTADSGDGGDEGSGGDTGSSYDPGFSGSDSDDSIQVDSGSPSELQDSNPQAVPLPATLPLVVIGLLGLIWSAGRRNA